MTKQQPRKRLHSHITRSRFLHLEDALDIGKVRLFAGGYRKGNGASSTAFHFLDLADARVIFSDLAWAKPVGFTDYKGTPARPGNDGNGPQSRVLKIKSKEDKVWFEVANGPGEVIGQGAVKPKGKPTAAVSIPLSTWEARKLAHACLAYIRAWENKRLLAKAPTAPTTPSPSQGEGRGGGGDTRRGAVSAPATASPRQVGTSPPLAGGTEGGHPATATVFWTLYNETAKPASVPYPIAQDIANKHGANGDGWHAAIEQLRQAIAEQKEAK